jgi:hypothetical protein
VRIAPVKPKSPPKPIVAPPGNIKSAGPTSLPAAKSTARSPVVNRVHKKPPKAPPASTYTPRLRTPLKRQTSRDLPRNYGPTQLSTAPVESKIPAQVPSKGPFDERRATTRSDRPSKYSGKILTQNEEFKQNLAKPMQPKTSAAAPAKTGKGEWTEGASVTVSGYKFSTTALSVCEGKCKIPMTGSRGPITAVFFKAAHGAAFSGKSSVSLTGIVRKTAGGDWQLIVSGVK